MTTYRLRVKLARDPTALWRDVVVGADRSLDELQTIVNDAVGLDQGHLWFFGTDRDYWASTVTYQCPAEFDAEPVVTAMERDEEVFDAGETTMGRMVEQLGLRDGDQFCYLYDYGDEWRFEVSVEAVAEDGASDSPPDVVDGEGEPVIQYPPDGEFRYR